MKLLRVLLTGILTMACGCAFANPATDMPPMYQYDMGTFHVTEYGMAGSPIILISGVAAGSWTWAGTVRRFAASHKLYVVTLSGFDGMAPPPQKEGYVQQAQNSIVHLMREREIVQPILIGHSLGGTLALRFAELHPDLVAGVVTVDGLPVDPGTESMSSEAREQMAAKEMQRVMSTPADQFTQQETHEMMTEGVMNPSEGRRLARLELRSDRATVAQYIGETVTLDIRPDLPQIAAPVLLVVPYNPADASRSEGSNRTVSDKVGYYQSLMAGTRDLQIVTIAPARHFVMFDQPKKFEDALAGFVERIVHQPLAN